MIDVHRMHIIMTRRFWTGSSVGVKVIKCSNLRQHRSSYPSNKSASTSHPTDVHRPNPSSYRGAPSCPSYTSFQPEIQPDFGRWKCPDSQHFRKVHQTPFCNFCLWGRWQKLSIRSFLVTLIFSPDILKSVSKSEVLILVDLFHWLYCSSSFVSFPLAECTNRRLNCGVLKAPNSIHTPAWPHSKHRVGKLLYRLASSRAFEWMAGHVS
jgi:hypothetical protein